MPLSTLGIAHQIVSSLYTYNISNHGTVNDCKVVINHLIRKFSEPLKKDGRQKTYTSNNVIEGEKIIKEHLIPVNQIMKHLLEMDVEGDRNKIAGGLEAYLEEALIIVLITKKEDDLLNSNGFQSKMPEEYFDPSNMLHNDNWARYKKSGIYNNINL